MLGIFAAVADAQDRDRGRRGTLSVPLDQAQPGGQRIELRYVRFRARRASRGTIVFLVGPGGGSVEQAEVVVRELLSELRRGHDIVFVDERGSGRSSPLRCPSLSDEDGDVPTPEAAARCGEELGDARRFYSTYATALDLEALRQRLGVERIIPFGVSSGGQVAGEYARRFPERVQALILDSPSPIEGPDLLGRLPQLALPRVLRELCYTPGCERILGDPQRILARAVEVLGEHPLRRAAPQRPIGVEELYELVRDADGEELVREELLAVLQAVAHGDGAPLRRLVDFAAGSRVLAYARFLATTCMEGQLPWAPESDPVGREAALQEALAGSAALYAPIPVEAVAPQLEARLCLGWPPTPRPPLPPSPERGPDVPVLILAGREDLRAPLEDQRRTASQYPSAQLLAVPGAGHLVILSDPGRCAVPAIKRFLAGSPVRPCRRAAGLYHLALPYFRTLREVPLPAGERLPPKIARTAVAVDLTLRDAENWSIEGAVDRGLRGGRLRFRSFDGGRTLVLELVRYELIRGVRVSGVLGGDDPHVLRVTGSGATGTLRLTGGHLRGVLRGVLDGHRVRYRQLRPRPTTAPKR
ncbi:MAG TPA: alpha/beta hydrolase [Solirubrobacteraceae bacterium]